MRLELIKREYQIQDKNTEIANIKVGIIERVEQLKLNMRINLELEATRALIVLEKKFENDVDSMKAKIFSLEKSLKQAQEPTPKKEEETPKTNLLSKISAALASKIEDPNLVNLNELNKARSQIADLMKEIQQGNFKTIKAEFEYEHLKQEYKRQVMEFEQLQNDFFHRRKAIQGLENESKNI